MRSRSRLLPPLEAGALTRAYREVGIEKCLQLITRADRKMGIEKCLERIELAFYRLDPSLVPFRSWARAGRVLHVGPRFL